MPLRERLGHAIAGFGQNLVYNVLTLFLLVYLYEDLKLSSRGIATLTVVLTVVRIWDAVNDVVIGLLIDRTRTRWGTFRPYPVITALPIAILTTVLFAIPAPADRSGETRAIILVAIAYLLWDMVYTASDVPFWSLTSVMTSDEGERTKIVARARIAAMLALATMTLGGPWLGSTIGWTWTAGLISFLGMALFTLASLLTRERVPHNPNPIPFREALRHIATNYPLHRVLGSMILGFGSTIFAVGGAVIAVVVFGDVTAFTVLGGALIGGMITGLLISPPILQHTTRRLALIGANLFGAVVFLALWLIGYASMTVVAAGLFLVGVSMGVNLVCTTAMIGDSADDTELRTGERTDGSCFAGMTFTTKLNSALATMVFGFAVAYSGYEADNPVTGEMRDVIWLACTILPAVSGVLSVLPLFGYSVDESTMADRLRAARAERAERAERAAPVDLPD
ncbi:MAG TPA: MFS transporter [Intrasporangiaceae bacterium]|nr:MFS transporter [Intrasporangiaceae bacterium]